MLTKLLVDELVQAATVGWPANAYSSSCVPPNPPGTSGGGTTGSSCRVGTQPWHTTVVTTIIYQPPVQLPGNTGVTTVTVTTTYDACGNILYQMATYS